MATAALGRVDRVTIDPIGNLSPPMEVVPERNTVAYEGEGERRVPLMISSEQAYYWTYEWQQGESQALKEINAGKGRVFETPKEAIHWLLSEESGD